MYKIVLIMIVTLFLGCGNESQKEVQRDLSVTPVAPTGLREAPPMPKSLEELRQP